MISAQFIFKPGTYDDEFHKLDAEIEAFVVTIPGFLGAEKWISFDGATKTSMYYFETMDATFQLTLGDFVPNPNFPLEKLNLLLI